MGDARDTFFEGVQAGWSHHRLQKMIPLGYYMRKEAFLNVGFSFNWDVVGHAVGVTGGYGLGDEVIADVHRYKAMYTLIQEHQTDVHSSL